MNKIYNINSIINEKYLYKSIIPSPKSESCIADTNRIQFSFVNSKFEKKPFYSNKIFFNKNSFTYFHRRKTDLKFVFLKKTIKPKIFKYNNVFRNIKQSKSNSLIFKPIKSGFRIVSHKYKGFVQRKDLFFIIKKFKIQLLNNSQNLINSVYLTNLHKLENFLFNKILIIRKKEKYNSFNFLKKKFFNKKKRKKIIKTKLQNKIVLTLPKIFKLLNKEHEKKIKLKKRIKKSYKQRNFKNKNNNKYFKKRTSVEQK
jgi:hypothetical protein